MLISLRINSLKYINKHKYYIGINSKRKTLVDQLTIIKIKFDKINYKRCSSQHHLRSEMANLNLHNSGITLLLLGGELQRLLT